MRPSEWLEQARQAEDLEDWPLAITSLRNALTVLLEDLEVQRKHEHYLRIAPSPEERGE